MQTDEQLKEIVKNKYSEIALQDKETNMSSCCGAGGCSTEVYNIMSEDYTTLGGYTADADLGLGCGLPTQFARIKKGDLVIDLGSGAGNDCFIARHETGETGKVIGIDFTPAMIDKARANAEARGFNNVEFSQKIYLLVSAGFYVFSIYQNIILCSRFNSNMVKIHNYFIEIKKYLVNTINSMENYLTYSSSLHTHYNFNDRLVEKMKTLTEIKNKVSNISEYKLSLKKIFEIGHILKYFYEIYENKEYNDAFIYSFGFNGYVDCIEGLVNNIREKKVNFAEFTNKKKKNSFKNNYYAVLKNNNPVKNNIKLEKNMIITGPNASGKTTVLKSVLINVILTQQFGCGFYDSAKIKPYKYIHCYLNIPDTSGRDSLFQSEARRCKEIIDIINNNKKDSHLCVFDELYSGTNPEEAIIGSTAFMEYLVKNKYVSSLLTTHFVDVCEKLKNNKNIINYHMDVTKQNNKIIYNYLFKQGISKIKGGLSVLYDMNYPKEIIENTIEIQKLDSLKENSLVK
jgi:DNA mismatch repair ATPase MutS